MKEVWGPVHGGVIQGLYVDGAPMDDCNAYCDPPIHCSLFYADATAPLEKLHAHCQMAFLSIVIVRIAPAPEAPPITAVKRKAMIHYGPDRDPNEVAGFLMFWRVYG